MGKTTVIGRNQWPVASGQWSMLRRQRSGFSESSAHGTRPPTTLRGFTLLELMIVITIVIILAAIVLPQYQKTITATREAVLRDDLFRMRSLLDQFAADKQKLPGSLDELVSEKYMRELPKDPITGNADWVPVPGDDPNMSNGTQGVVDLHSASTDTSSDGSTTYDTW